MKSFFRFRVLKVGENELLRVKPCMYLVSGHVGDVRLGKFLFVQVNQSTGCTFTIVQLLFSKP